MDKRYDAKAAEAKWYPIWEKNGYFHAEPSDGGTPYSVVIPPPNVTGILHMGHALNQTIQDVLVRWRRMSGFNTLWVPGTDHAGIATQNVVEKALKKEGKRRQDLGREKFLERVWEWKRQYGGTIVHQQRMLGNSTDWKRERFTFDEGCSKAVTKVFCDLYNEGLVYKGNYIVNWCPRCGTALANDEVEHEPNHGHFWYIRYPVVGSAKGTQGEPYADYVMVATTRPETLPGDTAVAVNPKDERYAHLLGKTVILPLTGREIPVIADDYVDREFGTGIVKITPAHDPNDFLVGKRHNLAEINIMNDDGSMNELAGAKYVGMDRFKCREAIVGGPLLPLPRGGGEPSLEAVVREDEAARRTRHRGREERRSALRPRPLEQDLLQLDEQHPGLVHLPPALVGPPHSRLHLPEVRRAHRRANRAHDVPEVRCFKR